MNSPDDYGDLFLNPENAIDAILWANDSDDDVYGLDLDVRILGADSDEE